MIFSFVHVGNMLDLNVKTHFWPSQRCFIMMDEELQKVSIIIRMVRSYFIRTTHMELEEEFKLQKNKVKYKIE